jgi:hypothetical protein
LAALQATQLKALQTANLAAMETSDLNALSPTQFGAFTTDPGGGADHGAVRNLSDALLQGMGTAQLAAIDPPSSPAWARPNLPPCRPARSAA